MNKLLLSVVVAAGLLLLDAPDAAAHGNGHDKRSRSNDHYSRSYERDYYSHRGHRRHHYASKYKRSKHMPYWLERDRSFHRWYHRTQFRADRRISWNRLFEFYQYEHSHERRHRY